MSIKCVAEFWKKKYKVNSQPTSSSWLVKGVRSRTQRGVAWVWVMVHDALLRKKTVQSRIQGRGPGGPGLPLFLDQNEARRTEKKLFWGCPPTPYLRVWMTPPPPPPLIWRSESATAVLTWGWDYRSSELAGLSWKRTVMRNLNPPSRLRSV